MKTCSRCRRAFYCNAECQTAAWAEHKKACSKSKHSESATVTSVVLRASVPVPRVTFDAPSAGDRALLNQVAAVVNGGGDKLVRALLKRGANPSSVCAEEFAFMHTSKVGLSALHVACFGGCRNRPAAEATGLIRMLTEEALMPLDWTRWAEISVDPPRQGTPFGAAIYGGTPAAALAVLRAVGAQTLAAPPGGGAKAEAARVTVGARVLMNAPCWVVPPSDLWAAGDWHLPLHAAAARADCETLTRLIDAGADVNARTSIAALSALELALGADLAFDDDVGEGATHATLLLLRAGASPHPSPLRLDSNRRAIDVAGGLSDATIFRALLAAGADPSPRPYRWVEKRGSFGTASYLTLAAEFGYVDIINDALRAGAPVDTRTCDSRQSTLLCIAACFGNAEVVDLLLALHAGVNAACKAAPRLCRCEGVMVAGRTMTALDAALHASFHARIVAALRGAGGLTAEELGLPGAAGHHCGCTAGGRD